MASEEPTLAEFLLTRFAVDEDGRARALRDLAEALRGQGYGLAADHLERESARVLAECEAKRRIVAIASEQMEVGRRTLARGWEQMAWDALEALALPYADHPDYQPEWRPDTLT